MIKDNSLFTMRQKEACPIFKNSVNYYKSRPEKRSFHNWIARLLTFLDLGKQVWPEPKEKEIEQFYLITGYRKKYWRKQ